MQDVKEKASSELPLGVFKGTNLRRWEIGGHAVTQGSGDECAPQHGAEVAGHDRLLLHAAVVLQGEDNRIIGRLMDYPNRRYKSCFVEERFRITTIGCIRELD